MKWAGVLAVGGVSVGLAVAWTFFYARPAQEVATATVTVADLATGQQLYGEVCASCHGTNLEGQPNWREADANGVFPAPPHDKTGHTWHHPDAMLFDYVKRGGTVVLTEMGVDVPSVMPGFGDQLSDAEIGAVLAYIKSKWPERERQVQAERTRADSEQGEN